MSDEELAEFLITFKNTFGEEYEGEDSCMDWLQSEAEQEDAYEQINFFHNFYWNCYHWNQYDRLGNMKEVMKKGDKGNGIQIFIQGKED